MLRFETVEEGLNRPVIRHLEKGFILTRIEPHLPETSMIIRIRPGWEELRAAILGQDGNIRCAGVCRTSGLGRQVPYLACMGLGPISAPL